MILYSLNKHDADSNNNISKDNGQKTCRKDKTTIFLGKNDRCWITSILHEATPQKYSPFSWYF